MSVLFFIQWLECGRESFLLAETNAYTSTLCILFSQIICLVFWISLNVIMLWLTSANLLCFFFLFFFEQVNGFIKEDLCHVGFVDIVYVGCEYLAYKEP